MQKKSVFYQIVQDWSEEWSKWDPYATKVGDRAIWSHPTLLTQTNLAIECEQ